MLFETGSSKGVKEYRQFKHLIKSPEELQDFNFKYPYNLHPYITLLLILITNLLKPYTRRFYLTGLMICQLLH